MKLNLTKSFLFFFKLCLFVLFFSCDVPEEKTESKDNINLGYAIAFKANECGNYPSYPLYIASGTAKPSKRDIQACVLTIIQQQCPFDNYPFYCLKIFKNFDYGIELKNPFSEKKD